ncbi:MAG: alanine racemase [bacterium]
MAKKSYYAPTIERKVAGAPGKFATSVPSYQDNIDEIPIKALIENYGSPLFVFSEKSIRWKFKEAQRAFSLHYPNVKFGWSYKTNYLQAICATFHQEGAWAEVVSGMEYERARLLGIPGKKIIFNGPSKTKNDLLKAVSEEATINIDHLDELFLLEEISVELGKKPRVGVRVNMDTGIYPQWSRFGFNYENREAYRAVQRIVTGNKLELIGLHTHIGTFILEPNAYYIAAAKLLNLAGYIETDFGITVQFIDLGGGIASNNTLCEQYLPGDIASPNIEQYAEAVGKAFNESPFCRKNQPTLFLETGRALIDEAGYLVSSVIGKKTLVDGQKALILDAGVNILYTSNWYKHKFTPAQPITGTIENTVIYGPLCMNIDVMRQGIRFPDLKIGDAVIISPVGAYNVTQWMQFITYRPNVVLITVNGDVEIIREKETLKDILHKEKLPKHLNLS